MALAHLTEQENKALELMNYLIAHGWEYPDAQFKTCQKTGLTCQQVQELYDSQFGE